MDKQHDTQLATRSGGGAEQTGARLAHAQSQRTRTESAQCNSSNQHRAIVFFVLSELISLRRAPPNGRGAGQRSAAGLQLAFAGRKGPHGLGWCGTSASDSERREIDRLEHFSHLAGPRH